MIDGFYVTSKGLEYLAKAAGGYQMVFTQGKFGNGIYPAEDNPISATDLVSPLGTMPISKTETVNNELTITTQFSNRTDINLSGILPAFNMTEIGLYAKLYMPETQEEDPDGPEALVLYAPMRIEQSDYIPAVLTEFIINWPLIVAEGTDITVVIDDSIVYPTIIEFNEAISHKVIAEGTGKALTGTVDITVDDETQLTVKLPANLEDGATFAVNGGQALPINTIDGKPAKKGPEAGSWLNLIMSEDNSCWYMLGGSSMPDIASNEEAIAGTDNVKMMTPLRVQEAMAKALENYAAKDHNHDNTYMKPGDADSKYATLEQLPEVYLVRAQETRPEPIDGKKIIWIKI